jgi:putative ABC transport system permease protein
VRELIWRLKGMLRRNRVTVEKREELQFHLDMEVDAGLRRGLSPDDARRRARLRAGLLSDGMESTRDAIGIRWIDGMAADLRHAFRALTRNPGFGTVAILVLAATVAVNTLIFFMLDGVVLRALPYQAPDRLVRIYETSRTEPKFPMSIGHYLDNRTSASTLDGIALYTGQDMELSATAGGSRRLTGVAITTEYFSVLGRTLRLGRAFDDADLRKGVRHVILSARTWRMDFQGDPAIVGRAIRLNREPWTVIGVAPDGFQHVGGEYRSPLQGETVDIWLPLAVEGSEGMLRFSHFCNAIARLRDGFTRAQATQELEALGARYEERYPKVGHWGVRMEPLLSEVTGRSSQVVWLLVAAGGLVLLVACANIAGLSVARAVARRRELSLRRALGANRWQLVRVGLAENLLIGVIGALLGLALAGIGLPLLRQLLPADFPRAHEIALTVKGALFAVSIALGTVLIAGLLASGGTDAMQSHQRVTAGRDARRLRTALVVGEIALAGLLCAGTLFLLRSYEEIGARDHGFNPAGVLTFRVTVPRGDDTPQGYVGRRYEDIRSQIASIPGVASVGASTNLPWSGYDENTGFTIVGRAPDGNDTVGPGARYQAASPGYFDAIGTRLMSGRLFDRGRDVLGQPLTVIVNQALATRYFPDGRAVGATIDVFGGKRQIVGVVADVKDNPTDLDTRPALWFPLSQIEFGTVSFAVRGAGVDPAMLTPAVTNAVHAVDPDLPLADIRTLEARAEASLAARRFALWLFQAFAALALVLAASGIYGLLAYVVRQRRKELSIRVALGASRTTLGRMVLSDGLRMASIGGLCCLLLTPVGGSLLQAFLYNVRSYDPVTIVGAPLALLSIAFLASLGPALSATRTDPARALRED